MKRKLKITYGQLEATQERVSVFRNAPVSYTHLDVYKRQHTSNGSLVGYFDVNVRVFLVETA